MSSVLQRAHLSFVRGYLGLDLGTQLVILRSKAKWILTFLESDNARF